VSLRAEKYDKARKSLLGGLKTIYDAALEAAKTAETGFRTRDRARLLAKLDAANRAVTESAVKDVAGFLFPPLEELEAGLTSPARDPYKRHLELSAKLYQALAEATAYTLKILT
jgi:hypothetical protein